MNYDDISPNARFLLGFAEGQVKELQQRVGQQEQEITTLRAALGRAVEALQSWLRCHENVPGPLCSGGFGEPACICADCDNTHAILGDPDGQQAGQEWAAMRECVEALRPLAALYDPEQASPIQDLCTEEELWIVEVKDLKRAHAALRRLEEVRGDD